MMELFEYQLDSKNLLLVKQPAFSYDLKEFMDSVRRLDFDAKIIANELMIDNYVEDAGIRDFTIITDDHFSDQVIIVTSTDKIKDISKSLLFDLHRRINHQYYQVIRDAKS